MPFQGMAQEIPIKYTPDDQEALQQYLTKITNQKIATYQGSYRKQAEEHWKKRTEHFLDKITDSVFLFDQEITTELQPILDEIYTSNTEIDPSNFRFFINQSPVPNAACYGNGVFDINNGLFSLTETDAELAFILCHEIAHYQLNHVELAVEQYFDALESKEGKAKIKAIYRERYGRTTKALEFFKDFEYAQYETSRKAESEADSLGLLYFKKTKYDGNASMKILAKLDFEDKAILDAPIAIEKHLNTKNYPFKSGWLKKEDNTLFDLDEVSNDYAFDKDSLKTHPDIPKRLEILKASLNTSEISGEAKLLSRVKLRSQQNSITAAMDNNKLDVALYFLLSFYNSEKLDAETYYFKTALLLRKLYESKKDHTLGKHVAPISPFSDEEQLNAIRRFYENIELKHLRKLGYWFCIENKEHFPSEEEYNTVFNFFKSLNPNIQSN